MGRQRRGRVLLAGGGVNCHLLGAVTAYGVQEVAEGGETRRLKQRGQKILQDGERGRVGGRKRRGAAKAEVQD